MRLGEPGRADGTHPPAASPVCAERAERAYAPVAQIAGIVQTQSYRRQYGASYISAMPTNLYGPGDNFDLETSHVLPALIRRLHEARRTRR
ncbi:GDP-L-fucose synthase [Streptomyces badius]